MFVQYVHSLNNEGMETSKSYSMNSRVNAQIGVPSTGVAIATRVDSSL